MALVVALAVLMIFVGFIRALWSRNPGDAPDGAADFGAPPEDASGDDAPPEDAPDGAADFDAPPENAPPEDLPGVSAPPWEIYPDGEWKLRDVEPVLWKGGAPPSLMEMFERVPEEPGAPADGWIMPEPDASMMENPEDYDIDNGDPEEPMWTPPEPPSGQNR